MSNQMDKINQALSERGVTQKQLAWIAGVTPPTVHNVISGKRPNPRIRTLISLVIGLPLDQVFPPTPKEPA